jgi:SAM-dependent methyltransferase
MIHPVEAFSNRLGRSKAQNICIRPLVLDICARYGGRRILCLKCDQGQPDDHAQDAGCAVEMDCGGNGTVNPIQWAVEDRPSQKQFGDSSQTEKSEVDLVVHGEIDDSHLEAPALVELVARRLRPQGILMIALPMRGRWETLWIAARAWRDYRGNGRVCFWSRQRLRAVLESHGFTILESIKLKTFSGRRPAIILVARKTGPSVPTNAAGRTVPA